MTFITHILTPSPSARVAAALAVTVWIGAAHAEPPELDAPPGDADAGDDDRNSDTVALSGGGDEPAVTPAIVVTGTRRDVAHEASPVRVDVIDARAIADSGARDAAEVLETRLGVEIGRSFRGAGAQVEGLDPRHVLILVDGVRLAGRTGEQTDISRIPAASIARVEIVKGAGSALYGSDALGGVIHIITKRAERPSEGTVTTSYGTGGVVTLTGDVGLRGDRHDVALQAGWRRLGTYRLDDAPQTSGSARDDVSVTLRGGADLSREVRVDGRVQYLFRELTGVDAQELPPTFTGEARWKVTDRVQRNHTTSGLLRATWTPALGQALEVDAAVSWYADALTHDQRGSDREDRREDTEELVGQLNARFRTTIGAAHLIQVGLETQLDALDSARVDGGEASRGRVAVYIQDEWTALDGGRDAATWVLVPAVRLDLDTQFGAAVSPRLATRVDPVSEVTVRADVGLGYRAPGFKELALRFENDSVGYAVVGNPELRPERSLGARAGVDWRFADALRLGATYFRHDVDDLILTVGLDPSTYTYVNIDSATSHGLEARASIGPLAGVSLDLGYTLTDARDDATGEALTNRSRHRGTVGLSFVAPAWGTRLSARAAFVGPRPVADPDDADGRLDADGYVLVDARVSHEVLDDALSLFVGVDNALNAGDAITAPIRPRVVYAGLTARR